MDLDDDELEVTKRLHAYYKNYFKRPIEVGEYIRTKDGVIAKIIENLGKDPCFYNMYYYGIDVSYQMPGCYHSRRIYSDMIKTHKKNLFELLEDGDIFQFTPGLDFQYIEATDMRNKETAKMLFCLPVFCNGWDKDDLIFDWCYYTNKKNIRNENIQWILTHEQINNNKYIRR